MKLGELCTVLDSQRKPVTKKDRVSGEYPYYGASGIQDYVNDYIFDGDYLLVGEDGAKWGRNDKSAFQIHGKCWVNNHAHILKVNNQLAHTTYLEYYLVGKDLNGYITGAVVPKLTQASLVSIPVPVPSIEEQKEICSLLDKMNRVIEAKKEQLKELDNLAQAIFYDMFGDPITNPKGWEMKKWESFGTIINGYAFNSTQFVEKGVPVLKIGNINTGLLKLENVSYYQYSDKLQRYEVHPNDVVLSLTGTAGKDDYGNVCIIPNVGVQTFYLNQRNAKLESKGMINNQVLKYIFACPSFKKELTKNTNGVRQGNILNNDIENLYLPLPPKSIQQSFADKIGAIERQKDLTNQSIREIQNLFDSRMDYYFGD